MNLPWPRRRREMDFETRAYLAELRRSRRGVPNAKKQRIAAAQREVDAFNAAHAVGTPVLYWPWTREGAGTESRTRTPAQRLGGSDGDTAVVWVEGRADCILLSHIEPITGATT